MFPSLSSFSLSFELSPQLLQEKVHSSNSSVASIFKNSDATDKEFEELNTNDTLQVTNEYQLEIDTCDAPPEHLAPPNDKASDGPQPPRGGMLSVAHRVKHRVKQTRCFHCVLSQTK